MSYDEAITYLESLSRFGSRLGLERITRLMELMAHPEYRLDSVHVAGTNGKGSVTAMVETALRSSGFKTGMYTSPYLEEFEERICIDGKPIKKETVADLVERFKPLANIMVREGQGHPTQFEVLTAMAFWFFAEQEVDYLACEVGLGGRYDATNVLSPMVSAITQIGMDHTDKLGNTIGEIAFQKAGIIKSGIPTVCSPQTPEALEVITDVCRQMNSELWIVGKHITWEEISYGVDGQVINVQTPVSRHEGLRLNLLGRHQQINAATALGVLERLRTQGVDIPESAIKKGLGNVVWPGRLEIVCKKPFVVLDGAHNGDGMTTLRDSLTEIFQGRRILLVLGILGDKPVTEMAKTISPVAARVIVTKPDSPRALSANELASVVRTFNSDVSVEPDIDQAIEKARAQAGPEDVVCITGSLYLVGKARKLLKTRMAFCD